MWNSREWLEDTPSPWLKWACLGVGGYKAAQFKYLGILSIATALTWICRRHGNAFDSFSRFSPCRGAPDEIVCFRKESILRMSFAAFLFFLVHILAVFLAAVVYRNDHDRIEEAVCALHSEMFTAKLLGFAILCAIAFVSISYRLFEGYFQIARCLACVYLLMQVVILLDAIFKVNKALLSKEERTWMLVLSSAFLYGGSITAVVLLYIYFPLSEGCYTGVIIVTVTVLFSAVMLMVSLAKARRQDTGLLTSALTTAYVIYLCSISVVNGATDSGCSPSVSGTRTARWMVVLSFVITLGALLISCFRTATIYGVLVSGADETAGVFDLNDINNDRRRPVTTLVFYSSFACATCFMLMVLANWTLEGTPGHFDVSRGTGSQWATAATAWACCCIYIWIVVAPVACPHRDF